VIAPAAGGTFSGVSIASVLDSSVPTELPLAFLPGSSLPGTPNRPPIRRGVGLNASPANFMMESSKVRRDPHSKLKAVIIDGGRFSALIYRCEANDPQSKGSWSEKLFRDCVRDNARWLEELGVRVSMLDWVHNEVLQKNHAKYNISLFAFLVENPTEQACFDLGELIMANINALEGEKGAKLFLDKENFFWLPKEKMVWASVIGHEKALNNLILNFANNEAPPPDFYIKNERIIHSYFQRGMLPLKYAQVLHAPMREVHPLQRPLNTTYENEGNVVELKNDQNAVDGEDEFFLEEIED